MTGNGWWAVQFEKDLGLMYRWAADVAWHPPRSGVHLTFVRGEWERYRMCIEHPLLELALGIEVSVRYDNTIYTNGESFWLSADCKLLDELREASGLGRFNRPTYHITLGNLKNLR